MIIFTLTYTQEYHSSANNDLLPSINDSSRGMSSTSSSMMGGAYDYRNSLSSNGYRLSSGGKFTASFCQSYLNKRERKDTLINKAIPYDNRLVYMYLSLYIYSVMYITLGH